MKTGQLAAIKIMEVTEVRREGVGGVDCRYVHMLYFTQDEEEEIRLEVDVLRKVLRMCDLVWFRL